MAWTGGGGLAQARSTPSATLLADGKVLVAGGGSSAYADLFDPGNPQPSCGNGIIDPPEVCDGLTLGGKDCKSLGYGGGILKCTSVCTFDTTGCVAAPPGGDAGSSGPVCGNGVCEATETCGNCPADCGACCGNGVVDTGEVCDGTALAGMTCQGLHFASGSLTCKNDCSAYDASGCVPYPACGDGTCDPTESCLTCPADCGACCGNGKVDPGEACDGSMLGGKTCSALGFASGTLGCAQDCSGFDTSACVPLPSCGDGTCDAAESCLTCPADCGACCGNGKIDPGEACDGSMLGGQTCHGLGMVAGDLQCSNCQWDESSCCQSVPLWAPPEDTTGVDIDFTENVPEKTGITLGVESSSKPSEPTPSDPCRSGFTNAGGANLCFWLAGQGKCFWLGLDEEFECTAPAVCPVPGKSAVCDQQQSCCSYSLTGKAGMDYAWDLSPSLPKSLGDAVVADVTATVGLSGAVTLKKTYGPGCQCDASEYGASVSLVGNGSLTGSFGLKLWGNSVSSGATGKLCAALGFEEELTCHGPDSTPVGGLQMSLSVPSLTLGFVTISGGDLNLINYPTDWSGTQCE